MVSTQIDQMKMADEEDEDFLKIMNIPNDIVRCMVLKTAIELDLFELINKAGQGAQLSCHDIASLLPTRNTQAPIMLDRILRYLASQSYLTCTHGSDDEDGCAKRLYGLAPISKHFIRNSDGASLAPLMLVPLDQVFVNTWFHLKDAILEGGIPFNRAYGMHAFEYPSKDSRFNEIFNKGMYNHTTIIMRRILEVYNGFEGASKVVDVGGGFGASLACIVSKHPNIKGVNFDLPHVIKDAPAYPGVEHVEGDMFVSVPTGDVIFMKWILHDWSDDHCLNLLKNCWKALPESGRVIIVEIVLPEYPETDLLSSYAFGGDIGMMSFNPGGKERTHRQFEALAIAAGFAGLRLVCRACNNWIIEIYKSL